jgi:antitoxin VapB
MALNIRSEEARRLAEEVARLTGETRTAAVTEALRQRLSQLRRESEHSMADRLMAIGEDCAARLKEPFGSIDHGELLFDGRGLPR